MFAIIIRFLMYLAILDAPEETDEEEDEEIYERMSSGADQGGAHKQAKKKKNNKDRTIATQSIAVSTRKGEKTKDASKYSKFDRTTDIPTAVQLPKSPAAKKKPATKRQTKTVSPTLKKRFMSKFTDKLTSKRKKKDKPKRKKGNRLSSDDTTVSATIHSSGLTTTDGTTINLPTSAENTSDEASKPESPAVTKDPLAGTEDMVKTELLPVPDQLYSDLAAYKQPKEEYCSPGMAGMAPIREYADEANLIGTFFNHGLKQSKEPLGKNFSKENVHSDHERKGPSVSPFPCGNSNPRNIPTANNYFTPPH